MTRRGIKRWYLVHKWTSLICTAFLLMLCVTGLPLIFEQELDHVLGYETPMAAVAPGTPAPSLDHIIASVRASRPGEVMVMLGFDEDRPIVTLGTAPAVDSPFEQVHLQPVDLRNGAFLPVRPLRVGIIAFLYDLHQSMFAGLYGTLFLGLMGLLFVIAVISGVVVYAPFMRRLDFGTIRRTRSKRLRWLDIHNLAGIAITAWLLVVGVTGVFNTLDAPLAMEWRTGQLAEMMAPYRDAPPLRRLGSVDAAVATARRASPDMDVSLVYYPGTFFSTPHHYNVFMRGRTPVTSRLIKPTLVDADTAALTDTRDMPLHIRALFLSRPLHFGDYGGLPLKIVWALLDLMAILVLGSGVYLWLGRRGAALDRRVEELVAGGAVPEPAE
jgi:uncharacterized iron-regulated membrane protein